MTDEETIIAYVDGELDAAAKTAFEARMAADAELAGQVARHRALRQAVGHFYAGDLDEPVPERLLAAVRGPAATDNVIRMADRRPKTPPRLSWTQGGALAACLAAGLIIGVSLMIPRNQPPLSSRGDALMAQGALAHALDRQLASNADPRQPIRIGLSFRSTAKTYCRTFQMSRPYGLAGVACRGGEGWRIQTATATEGGGGSDYRMAASALPAPVLAGVEAMIDGQPLDAAAEAAAQRKHWKN